MNFNASFKSTIPSPSDIHISLDIETVSVHTDAAIIQLAASTSISGVRRVFEEKISLASNEQQGRVIDKETMEWWDKQDQRLRRRVFSGNMHLHEVLQLFTEWCSTIAGGDLNRVHLWGNGCDFDNAILKNAYETFTEYPFNFRQHQHLRTLMYVTPANVQEQAHKTFVQNYPDAQFHDALADATYQLYKILAALRHHHGSA